MQAQEKTLIEFLRDKQQCVVPMYQRRYSWTLKQCTTLWENIQNIANNDEVEYHFIGSIVRIKRKLDTSEISQQIIIDGQQRITTLLLLLSALVQAITIKDRSEELQELYLINKHGKEERKYKMLLTEQDKSSLIDIIENRPNAVLDSERIKENFDFFKREIAKSDPEKIYAGIRKLMIVDISLDPEHDNPQLIFESLNSTGLELTQVDLIRNYILMGLEFKFQEKLYHNYWRAMEKNFGQTDTYLFNSFVRDYLTMKTGAIPKLENVYETFKIYFSEQGGIEKVEEILTEVHKCSKYYVRMALEKEENITLREAFSDITDLRVAVAYPFLLNIYNDYEEKVINEEIFLDILRFIQSYVLRRFVCGYAANTFNFTFAALYKSIDKEHYLDSLKAVFVLMSNNRRFPSDIEFIEGLKENNLYNIRNRNFWLRKFENYSRKERINVEEYTIEHIMPQNIENSNEWKEMLGENWKEVHERYLHTIGNLTLTGYNSELSNKPFSEKKRMEGGFDSSPLKLNKSLQQVSVWNETTIRERAETLAKIMIEIWPYPIVSEEIVEKYKQTKREKKAYSIEDYPFLTEGPMKELFEIVRKRILNLDTSVKEEFLKCYVAYKTATNFVDIVPLKSKLGLSLNIDYEEIYDPKNLCRNVTNIGRWGNGNTAVQLFSPDQIEDVVDLIKQAFEKNTF